VEALEPDQLAEIRAYLNFDMLGSPNAVVFVYDEPEAAPGSVALTNVFSGFFAARGIAWDPIDLDGDSDHGPFIAAGIPTGGLFSGGIEPVTDAQAARHGSTAGEPADPCSHRACDTIDNVDISTLLLMTDAISYALAVLSGAAG
jgi:Zn-dependent M28 family amino/carboxypeptidase